MQLSWHIAADNTDDVYTCECLDYIDQTAMYEAEANRVACLVVGN